MGSEKVAQRILDRLPEPGEYFNPSRRKNKLGEPTTLILDKVRAGTTIITPIKYGRVAGGVPVDMRRLARAFTRLGAVNNHVPVMQSFEWRPGSGDNNKILRRPRPGDGP